MVKGERRAMAEGIKMAMPTQSSRLRLSQMPPGGRSNPRRKPRPTAEMKMKGIFIQRSALYD